MVLVVERAVVLERLLTAGLVAARIKAQVVEQVAAQKNPLMAGLTEARTKAQLAEQAAAQERSLNLGLLELLKTGSNLLNLKHLNLEKQQDNTVGLIRRCIPKQMSIQEAS